VSVEVKLFLLDGILHRDLVDDVFLGSVLDTDETESELHFLVVDHALGVGTSVHDIDLGDNTDGSDSLGVKLTGHLEAIRGGHISISRDDTKNDGSGVGDVSVGHSLGDLLDVASLVSSGDTGDTGEIDEGEVGAGVGVDLQHDGPVDDVLGATGNLVSQLDNCVAHFLKHEELLVGHFFGKHSPRLLPVRKMVQSQFQRTSRDNTL